MHTVEELISVVPEPRQVRYQERGFIGFIHFTVNTFTDREWGDGTEDPSVFAPTALDPRQWARTAREAGMKGLILTCRHHDGFCLWPTRTTAHSVAASPCPTDVVGACAAACRAEGLDFGVYLSPWDRHSPVYGQGKAYDDVFVAQLTELLTGYGPVFCVWLDGACGEGPNGKKQVYDWDLYVRTVRSLQPDACVCVCGPDIRWCGNERGETRPAEWSVVDAALRDAEKVAEKSQHADDEIFRTLSSRDPDLGSREALAKAEALCWYPCEVNTSIRPGWFWHRREDGQVKSPETLFDLYERTVGGNAVLLLNVPPDSRGLLADPDVAALRALGGMIRGVYGRECTAEAELTTSSQAPGHAAACLLDPAMETCWSPETDGPSFVCLRFPGPRFLKRLVLQENILRSQRVEEFAVDLLENGAWTEAYRGETIGFRRILPVDRAVSGLRVRFLRSRGRVMLRRLQVF